MPISWSLSALGAPSTQWDLQELFHSYLPGSQTRARCQGNIDLTGGVWDAAPVFENGEELCRGPRTLVLSLAL